VHGVLVRFGLTSRLDSLKHAGQEQRATVVIKVYGLSAALRHAYVMCGWLLRRGAELETEQG
jgi:hypothetical protein